MTRPSYRPAQDRQATERTVVETWSDDRQYSLVLRQVGWLGQSGAIYSLEEDPSLTERGSFGPLWTIAHSDRIPTDAELLDAGLVEPPAPPEPKVFVDVQIMAERRTAPRKLDPEDRLEWRETRRVVIDGQPYEIPAHNPVLIEAPDQGPQLVTLTFMASGVEFVDVPARGVSDYSPAPTADEAGEPIEIDGGIAL